MFELHKTYDLLSSLSEFIYSTRQPSDSASTATSEPVITPRILNQEKGGIILFVWVDQDKDKPSSLVTNFGIYEPDSQKHLLIYTYDKKVKVVSCSLNQERTLLAFSIVRPKESSVEKKHKDVYQAYLAELQSVDKTVYSLNMERSTFLKVQFLYPDLPAQSPNRESYMIVLLHKESIGLYKVPMARIGDRGIMMSSQPKTEQIVRRFVWCQWDCQHQRLHYIHNVRVDSASEIVRHNMSTVQFYGKGRFENVIDIPVNFPFPYIRTADKPHYGDIPLHPGIPELTLNVTVLTQSSGTFCLCYHKMMSDSKAKSGVQPSASDEVQNVEYYISMVHHAKTLYGCVSSLPKDVVVQKRLVFSMYGSYLVVMLPGFFLHLLNVGQGFEPCHHILLHNTEVSPQPSFDLHLAKFRDVKPRADETPVAHRRSSLDETPDETPLTQTPSAPPHSPQSPSAQFPASSEGQPKVIPVFSQPCAMMKTLLPCQAFVRESGQNTQHLYDYRSGCLLKLTLDTSRGMLESFRGSYWPTRLAILHYLVLHCKDLLAIRLVFETLCENVTNAEINAMLTEYLVAATFSEMKKQVDREVLNLLPFTSIETLRGQYEKSLSGERLAHISYLSLEVVTLNKRPYRDSRSRSSEDFWDTLIRRLHVRHSETSPRFSHVPVMRNFRQSEIEEALGKTVWDSTHVPDSFFDGVFTLKLSGMPAAALKRKSLSEGQGVSESASGRRSKIDSVLGEPPLFLHSVVPKESQVFKRRLSKMTEDYLTNHLTRCLRKESRSKASNVAKEYLLCQAKVSRQLCHILWSLRSQTLAQQVENCLLPNLQEPGTDEEYELFQLFERFYLATGDLGFPLPPSFSSFFTALGFKCLELHLFFQYVDNHVLVLTPDFILQLLEDLHDDCDPDVPAIKFQVISRLPKGFAEQCFERWNHPIIQQRRAREQVAQLLLQVVLPKKSQGQPKTMPSSDSCTFPPLNTFISHLHSVAARVESSRPVQYNTQLIQETALHHTSAHTDLDLSTVNF